MIFSIEEQKLIKIGYLKWKKPKQIALFLNLTPLDVHNFIQGNHQEWAQEQPFCAICNTDIKKHKKCSLCECLVHDEEQIHAGRVHDWYKMFHLFGEEYVCNWCVTEMGRKYYRDKHQEDHI